MIKYGLLQETVMAGFFVTYSHRPLGSSVHMYSDSLLNFISFHMRAKFMLFMWEGKNVLAI